jgi:hypothetical protein
MTVSSACTLQFWSYLRWFCGHLPCVFVNVIVLCILNCRRFGNLGGFQILLERFQSGKNLTVTVIYALIRPFGLCYEFLTVHTIVKYFMPIIVSLNSLFLNVLKWKELWRMTSFIQESYFLNRALVFIKTYSTLSRGSAALLIYQRHTLCRMTYWQPTCKLIQIYNAVFM